MSSSGQPSTTAPPPYRPYRLTHTLLHHSRAVSCVKFCNDGHLLPLPLPLAVLSGHSAGVSDVAWSSDSRYLASASDDCSIRIWDVRSPNFDCVRTLHGHSNFVFCVNFNSQSNLIVSGKCVKTIVGHEKPVTSVHFIRDGSIVGDHRMHRWCPSGIVLFIEKGCFWSRDWELRGDRATGH